MTAKRSKSNNILLTAILYIVVGLLFCIFKGEILKWGIIVAGIVLLVIGVVGIVKKNYVEGIIMSALGVILILAGWSIAKYLLIALGVFLAIKGIIDLCKALTAKKKKKNILAIIGAIVAIVIGIMLAFSALTDFDILLIIGGIVLIVDGILLLFGKKS